MNYIEVFNETSYNIEDLPVMEKFIKSCAKKLKLKNIIFNVIIIKDEQIHSLNKLYRNVDRSTDVITFALEDNKQIQTPTVRVLGDIYISYDKVIKQSEEYGHSKKRELCFLAAHGFLHLLGYDHQTIQEEEIMFKLQKELLETYGIKKK
ncbi:MAG: rRNA maturation RNase YbeY [Bacilli bacterium]